MDEFLNRTRRELIDRCKAKVAKRPRRAATPDQLRNGVPLFLEQLIREHIEERDDGRYVTHAIGSADHSHLAR